MARQRMNADDAIRGFRLVNRCRDLGADSDAWRSRLFDGIRELVNAQVVIGGEMRGFDEPSSRFESLALHRVGWPSEQAERSWAEYAESTPMERTPEYPVLRNFDGPLVTLRRDKIWAKEDWYRSKTFNDVHRACGIDDYIISIRRLPRLGHFTSLFIHRAIDDPAFTNRDVDLVNLVHHEIGEMIGGELAAAAEPKPGRLTPRQREVLDYLLDGDSEKRIAYALDLSRATVHEYVTAVYRHFEVSSRAELLALFVGRARPPRVS